MSGREKKIIKKILNGDTYTFEKLLEQYYNDVYRICWRFMKNEQDTKDMVQEVFINIYSNLDKFKFKSKFSTWVYRICANTCLKQLDRNKKLICFSYDSLIQNDTLLSSKDELSDIVELRNAITVELDKFGGKHADIAKLRLFKNYSFKKISNILGIPSSTARVYFSKTRKYLQNKLKDLRE